MTCHKKSSFTWKTGTLLLSIIIFITNVILSQEVINFTPNIEIGRSFFFHRNINHPDATYYQDVKKATSYVIFYNPIMSKFYTGTAFLVNTVDNTFDANEKKIYLMTVDHLKFPVGINLNGKDVTEEQLKSIFLSFDYETANPLKRVKLDFANENELNGIKRLWRVNLIPKVQDRESDIALYEVVPYEDYPFTINDSDIFEHVYAMGWTTNINSFLKPFSYGELNTLISHPRKDLKKFMSIENMQYYHTVGERDLVRPIDPKRGYGNVGKDKAILIMPTGVNMSAETSSSGSPLLNSNKDVIGIQLSVSKEPKENSFTLLENSWYYSQDNNGLTNQFLQTTLDPNKTWISSVKGGYLADLIKNPKHINYDLSVSTSPLFRNVTLKISSFFKFEPVPNKKEQLLGHGILLKPGLTLNNNQRVYLSLHENVDGENPLLYGGYINHIIPSLGESEFNSIGWSNPTNSGPVNDSSTGNFIPTSTDIKSRITKLLKNKGEDLDNIMHISKYVLDANIKLQTDTGDIQVRAIKLPTQMPYNAREVFEPGAYDDLWASNKYRENRFNSMALYIDKVKISSRSGQGDNAKIVSTKIIETSNNGGYLNLVNPNYSIDPLELSVEYTDQNGTLVKIDRYIDIDIFLNKENTGFVAFSVWIDYWNRDTSVLGINPVSNTYNFVNDGPLGVIKHTSELVDEGFIFNGNRIQIKKRLANVGVGLNNSIVGKKRLRIAVKQGITPPTQSEVSNTVGGEVEDYLVNTVLPKPLTNEIINVLKESLKRLARIWLRRQHRDGEPDAGDPPCDNNNNNPQDETPGNDGGAPGVTQTCNTIAGPCSYNGSCYIEDNNVEGGEYIDASLGNYVKLDLGNHFIHDAVETRIIISTIQLGSNAVNEKIYDEGGSKGDNEDNNGLGVFINDQGYAVFEVSINGQQETIVSLEKLTHNREVTLEAKFNKGVMTLMLDGQLQGTNIIFAKTGVVEIPYHSGDANWGGGNSSVKDDDLYGNFSGKLIELLIYDDINLNKTYTDIITSGKTINPSNKFNTNSKHNTDKNNTSFFTIFPIPAKDELNIVLEIQQVSPVHIGINDLTGRLVYNKNWSNISRGHHLIKLQRLNLSSGNYILKIKAGKINRSKMIVIK